MNKIKSFVEKFQMFITNLPKFEATGTESIGSLDPKETAQCYRKVGGSYLVVYNLSGTTKHILICTTTVINIFYQKAFLSQVDINIVLLAHTMLRKILFQHKKSMVHLTY